MNCFEAGPVNLRALVCDNQEMQGSPRVDNGERGVWAAGVLTNGIEERGIGCNAQHGHPFNGPALLCPQDAQGDIPLALCKFYSTQ